uniref:GCP_C_terminal domain-containing protein n=1 Tax=Rhodnius prolixus TaxID=13249 RepID=T1I5T2_RHOPR
MPHDIITNFSLTISPMPSSMLSNNILEKINYLSFHYDVHPYLRLIITEDMISDYNKLFKFLLQLKYAYKTLHKMRYGVHRKFIKQCKEQFFFHNIKLQKLLQQLFRICATLFQYWFLEEKGLLTILKIENLEKDFLDVMSSIGSQVETIYVRSGDLKYNLHFEMLHDEILYNMPSAWD